MAAPFLFSHTQSNSHEIELAGKEKGKTDGSRIEGSTVRGKKTYVEEKEAQKSLSVL